MPRQFSVHARRHHGLLSRYHAATRHLHLLSDASPTVSRALFPHRFCGHNLRDFSDWQYCRPVFPSVRIRLRNRHSEVTIREAYPDSCNGRSQHVPKIGNCSFRRSETLWYRHYLSGFPYNAFRLQREFLFRLPSSSHDCRRWDVLRKNRIWATERGSPSTDRNHSTRKRLRRWPYKKYQGKKNCEIVSLCFFLLLQSRTRLFWKCTTSFRSHWWTSRKE